MRNYIEAIIKNNEGVAQGYYPTDGSGNPFAMVNYQYYPNIWCEGDKSYITWQQRDGYGWKNASMITPFNHTTKKAEKYVNWGKISDIPGDVHLMPAIIGTADNRILVMREDPHIGKFYPRKSGANYEIKERTVYSPFHDKLSYPHLYRFSNGNIFCVARESGLDGSGLNEESGASVFKSTDNGQTFTRLGYIHYFTQISGVFEWAYPLACYSNDNKIRLFINRRRGVEPVSFPVLYYVESTDGITWTNKAGTFSKNISSNNFITTSEMEANCKVLQLGDGSVNGKNIRANGAMTAANGEVFCIGGMDNATFSLQLIYSSGSTWVTKPITVAGHNIPGVYAGTSTDPDNFNAIFNNSTALIDFGTYIDAFVMELIGGHSQLCRIRTTDLGTTWTYVERLTTLAVDHWDIQITANYKTTGKGVVACVAQVSPDYSDLFIKEIT